jgi:hypothetical protein
MPRAPQAIALPLAEGQNAAMGECILGWYRDAAQPAMAQLGRHLEQAAERPGLSIMASEDHLAGTDEQRRRTSARARAQIAVVYPRPSNGAPRPSTTSGQESDKDDPKPKSEVVP